MAKKRKNAPVAAPSGAKRNSRFPRYCIGLVLVGVGVLVWLSLLTFNPYDWSPQAQYPRPQRIDNAAGAVGAYVAYQLRYWLGGGAYVGALFATVAAVIMLMRRRIGELPRRALGVAVLTTATAAAVYLANPGGGGDPSQGLAGIVGTGIGQLLLANFAPTGGWVILIVVLCMGLVLSADRLLVLLYHLIGRVWRRRARLAAIGGKLATMPLTLRRTKSPPAVTVSAPRPAPMAAPAAPVRPAPVRMRPAAPKAAPRRQGKDGKKDYILPSSALLAEPSRGYAESQESNAWEKRGILQRTLTEFNVAAEVVGHMTGPVITMFELSLAAGVKVAQVARLSNDISRALAVPNVRVVSPLPGRDTIGIEVPNMDKEIVRIRELMDMEPDADRKMFIPLYLGKDAEGKAIVSDLAGMPHMLIAGTTGSGKSVCINSIIVALLIKRRPEDVRLILVDPKMVEMAAFENIPHLLCPIVNDMRRAENILEWAATKMDERYDLLREAGVKNIASYNKLSPEDLYDSFGAESEEERAHIPTHLPYYVIIVDELADLIMTSSKEVEGHIIRIAQKARAVGIHLILATQRPSVNVVTGLIKSNMPCRISFRVASRQESRIVLDQNGAEVLLGQGDMLFLQPGTSNLLRAQGTYVDDAEIRPIVKALKRERDVSYNNELMRIASHTPGEGGGERDELFDKGVEIVLSSKRGSVSLLQRRLSVGYSRASRIIDQMANAGLLGDYKGSQARECLVTLDEWRQMQQSITADQSGLSSLNGTPTSV